MAASSKSCCAIRPTCANSIDLPAAYYALRAARSLGVRRSRAGGATNFLLPGHWQQASINLLHRDAAIHGANQRAKIAAHALVVNNFRHMDFHAVRIALAVPVFSRGRPVAL